MFDFVSQYAEPPYVSLFIPSSIDLGSVDQTTVMLYLSWSTRVALA